MPTRYRCSDCHLGFETGWYHYHRESNGAMAATSLVCARCGAAYLLDHKYDGARDQLYAWGGPVTWVPTKHDGWYQNAPGTPEITPVAREHDFRPVRQPHESARLEGVLDDLNLAGFACVFCHALGTLKKLWPDDETRCPRCGKDELRVVGIYMT
jgi:DNA-directed RNA polymerase subunit RPC12/RpoP